jgi:hypothetical protein
VHATKPLEALVRTFNGPLGVEQEFRDVRVVQPQRLLVFLARCRPQVLVEVDTADAPVVADALRGDNAGVDEFRDVLPGAVQKAGRFGGGERRPGCGALL